MESVCLELDEGFRESLWRVYMLRGEERALNVTSTTCYEASTTQQQRHSVKYYPTQINAASFPPHFQPTPLSSYVTQRQSNFKNKGTAYNL